jgi:hypothetical protein
MCRKVILIAAIILCIAVDSRGQSRKVWEQVTLANDFRALNENLTTCVVEVELGITNIYLNDISGAGMYNQ